MAHWEPKLGDIVTLKSETDIPMTVIGYDPSKRVYGVAWIAPDKQGHAMSVPAEALAKYEKAPEVDPAELAQGLQIASQELESMRSVLAQSRESLTLAGNQLSEICSALQRIVPKEAWSSNPTAMAAEAARRYETMRLEANEQITRLNARVVSLGG